MEANLKIDESSKTAELILSGSLSIQYAAELKKVLTETLHQADTTLLDLENVEVLDLSSIQLLYAFHLAGTNSGKVVRLRGECPDRFRKAVEEAGLSWDGWLCFGES